MLLFGAILDNDVINNRYVFRQPNTRDNQRRNVIQACAGCRRETSRF